MCMNFSKEYYHRKKKCFQDMHINESDMIYESDCQTLLLTYITTRVSILVYMCLYNALF